MALAMAFNLSTALGEMKTFVQNPSTLVSPGIQLICYGPFYPPSHALSLYKMLPEVDMSIVHHIIMFGGRRTAYGLTPTPRANTDICYRGNIVYAWARTGQQAPIGLDFDANRRGDGFAVGVGTSIEWLAVQIHYQQLGAKAVLDASGVHVWFHPRAPSRPLEVELMLSAKLRIPPRVKFDECVACRVEAGGEAVAFRNHAHRLARDIWAERYDAAGRRLADFGRRSALEPQVFTVLDSPVQIRAGETFLLHCEYDATQMNSPTFVGADERTHEMCNQYIVSTAGLQLACWRESMQPDPLFASQFEQTARLQSSGGGIFGAAAEGYGQVTAVTTDRAHKSLYFFHRSTNRFGSRSTITKPAIIHIDLASGKLRSQLGANTFVVPHGLSMDYKGFLWATDVGTHRVFRLDPASDQVLLTLGNGQPGAGSASFNQPTDVAVSPYGDEVFVADGYGNSRVAVFTYGGQFLREWGSYGTGPGQFRIPHSITIDSDGDVYVADRENSRVQVFDRLGKFKAQWQSPVAALSPSRQVWSRHLSSISYNEQLDAFVVVEGSSFHIRTRSGCEILAIESSMNWPHDAILLPAGTSAKDSHSNNTALSATGREYRVFIAELDGHRVLKYQTPKSVQTGNRGFDLYG